MLYKYRRGLAISLLSLIFYMLCCPFLYVAYADVEIQKPIDVQDPTKIHTAPPEIQPPPKVQDPTKIHTAPKVQPSPKVQDRTKNQQKPPETSTNPLTWQIQTKDQNYGLGFWDWQWDLLKYTTKDIGVELSKFVANFQTKDYPNKQVEAKQMYDKRMLNLIQKYGGANIPREELERNWNQYLKDSDPGGAGTLMIKFARSTVGIFIPDDKNNFISVLGKIGLDFWTAWDNAKDVKEAYHTLQLYNHWKNTDEAAKIFSSANTFYGSTKGLIEVGGVATKVVSKANIVTSLAGSALSAIDAYRAFNTKNYADGIASTGDFIMGLAPAALAIGGPAAGLGVLAVGGAIWLGATAYKYYQNGYFKSAWNMVKSWFS